MHRNPSVHTAWSVATNAKDWHGLTLEKVGWTFSSFNAMPANITKKIILLNSTGVFCVKFNKRVGVFYTPIKHDPRVYWTTSKTFLEKRVSMELITMTLLWTLEISIQKKTLRMKLLCKKIKSHMCLEIFQSKNDTNRKGNSVLFLSFSEALKRALLNRVTQ